MKKRAHGDGYVKRLPNGTWFGQIMDGYKENGKKNIVSFTAPTKSEVHHMAWDREKMMDKTIQMEQGGFDHEK